MSTTQTTMSTMSTDEDKNKSQDDQTRKIIGAILILLIIGLILYLIFKPKSIDTTSTTSAGKFDLTSTPELLNASGREIGRISTETKRLAEALVQAGIDAKAAVTAARAAGKL